MQSNVNIKLFGGTPRDPKRIEKILGDIKLVWEKYPDFRFYQLIALFERDYSKRDKFYVEDSALEQGIEEFKKLRGLK